MQDRRGLPDSIERRLKLHQAAGVSADNYIGAKSGNELSFAIAERVGCIGLNEIVNARRSAADGRLRNFEQFEAGNS